eukprot:TRINITY_DN16239_c0_g3_i2.p2 TRINITY_DN16239_c0_g3~~TRINITY_DN16239_c0_g3_i2.p2  ORF type:complete len:106 (+),score=5.05 TRINITY_DN16239_c0_g3_i2:197-514(+)
MRNESNTARRLRLLLPAECFQAIGLVGPRPERAALGAETQPANTSTELRLASRVCQVLSERSSCSAGACRGPPLRVPLLWQGEQPSRESSREGNMSQLKPQEEYS